MPANHNMSTKTIRGLWNNWAYGFGAIALVMFLSLFIPKTILPFVLFILAFVLMSRIKAESSGSKIGACHLILWAIVLILFWSGLVMVVINILRANWFFDGRFAFEPFNPRHPYVCSLIIFPISLGISVYFLIRGHKLKICQNCHHRFGYYDPKSAVARLYYQEARYQLRMMMWLSLLLSCIDWLYYYLFYINVNYNTPDKFYFIFMPIAVYVISLVYMTVRYMTMADELAEASNPKNLKPMKTLIRYLVLDGDSILLNEGEDRLTDTPAKITIPHTEELSIEKASREFSDISGLSDFDTRYLYSDNGFFNKMNIVHYAAFLKGDANDSGKLSGEWLKLDELNRRLKEGRLAPQLYSELTRIYNITMAWKTYKLNGERIYPIKHYIPTFRLRDFPKWNVDYTDLRWLDIASNNQDRSFFKLRRFWRKHFRH